MAIRSAFSLSCPIDTHVSVATTSAPATACDRVAVTATDPPVPSATRAASAAHDRRVGLEAAGAADPHVHAGDGAAEQVGVGHVVGTVAEVGQREPGERPLVRADGLQVGEDLARVEVVAERVDDRDAG